MAYLRSKNQAFLCKVETTEGVDSSPVATDAVAIDDGDFKLNPEFIEPTEATGTLSPGTPVIGKVQPDVTGAVKLKGSGVAETPPEVAPLIRACGMKETIRSATIPTSSTTTAASGTTTTFVVDRSSGNGSDWPATSGALVGHFVTLAGNPVTPVTVLITGYVVSGNNATVTIDTTMGSALSSSTTAVVPKQVVYSPDSTVTTSVTTYVYKDGLLYKFLGCRAEFDLNIAAGNKGDFAFRMKSLFGAKSDAAVPAVVLDTTKPPIWRGKEGGKMLIHRIAGAVTGLRFSVKPTLVFPDNPNAQEGIDAPQLVYPRTVDGEVDPASVLVASGRDSMADLFAQNEKILSAQIGATAGNRIGVVIPRAMFTDASHKDQNGILKDQLPFRALGNDTEGYLAFA